MQLLVDPSPSRSLPLLRVHLAFPLSLSRALRWKLLTWGNFWVGWSLEEVTGCAFECKRSLQPTCIFYLCNSSVNCFPQLGFKFFQLVVFCKHLLNLLHTGVNWTKCQWWPFQVQYLQREGGRVRRFLRDSFFFCAPRPPYFSARRAFCLVSYPDSLSPARVSRPLNEAWMISPLC